MVRSRLRGFPRGERIEPALTSGDEPFTSSASETSENGSTGKQEPAVSSRPATYDHV
jgi:hypothetical protein